MVCQRGLLHVCGKGLQRHVHIVCATTLGVPSKPVVHILRVDGAVLESDTGHLSHELRIRCRGAGLPAGLQLPMVPGDSVLHQQFKRVRRFVRHD